MDNVTPNGIERVHTPSSRLEDEPWTSSIEESANCPTPTKLMTLKIGEEIKFNIGSIKGRFYVRKEENRVKCRFDGFFYMFINNFNSDRDSTVNVLSCCPPYLRYECTDEDNRLISHRISYYPECEKYINFFINEENSVNIDIGGFIPLHDACYFGNLDIVKECI